MSDLTQRIFTIMKESALAGFATIAADGNPWVRYVVTHVAEDLTIRFSTFADSRKVAQIQKNPEVHLTCGVSDPATAKRYLQIQGKAEFTTDKTEREACWNDQLKKNFKGPDDSNYGIIIVKPYRIELYSMEHPKLDVWEK
jgi:general stress protein 26